MRISDWSSDVCSSDLIRLQALHVEADVFRDGEDAALVSSTSRLHQRFVEREVKALPVGGEGGLGGKGGAGAEDGELLVDDAQLRIGGFGVGHHRGDPAAVGAVIVEELDEADVAIGIAGYRAHRVAKYLVGSRGEGRFDLAGCRGLLARLQNLHGLDDHLGVFQEIGPDAPAELVRSEEHTSELQSLMRNSYALF